MLLWYFLLKLTGLNLAAAPAFEAHFSLRLCGIFIGFATSHYNILDNLTICMVYSRSQNYTLGPDVRSPSNQGSLEPDSAGRPAVGSREPLICRKVQILNARHGTCSAKPNGGSKAPRLTTCRSPLLLFRAQ